MDQLSGEPDEMNTWMNQLSGNSGEMKTWMDQLSRRFPIITTYHKEHVKQTLLQGKIIFEARNNLVTVICKNKVTVLNQFFKNNE